MSFGKGVIIDNMDSLLVKKNNDIKSRNHENNNSKIHRSTLLKLDGVFDDRARSVDFILLTILLDLYFDNYLTLFIFIFISIKLFLKFLYSFVYGVRSSWAESTVEKINNIKR